MGTHIPPLSSRRGNLIVAEDGTIWCNYLLTGIRVNSYRPDSALAAQDSHQLLLTALSGIPTDDIMLSGLKVRIDPVDTAKRIVGGIPDWDPQRYRYLHGLVNEFYKRMVSGEFTQFDRVYWLAISQPSRRSLADQLVSSMVDVDPNEGLDWTNIADFEQKCFDAIPPEFRPTRTTPESVDWCFERATYRGLITPIMPKPGKGGASAGERTYPEVLIDESADSSALYSTFLRDIADGRVPAGSRKPSLRQRFRTLRAGKVMSIAHPGKRIPELPDGAVSYQSMLGISRYPARYNDQVSSFTYLVDQAIDVDADFTLRMRFSQSLTDTASVSETERNLISEGEANSEDEFEAFDYDSRRVELRRWHNAVRAESGARGMEVAAIFAFGSNNLDHLNGRMAALNQHFRSNGFTPLQPVGGQRELWTMMMPGSRRTRLGDDLMQTTTAYWFSGAMPIRRSFAGDEVGMPLAVNRENANGQIILLDLLGATDRGNASIAMTGAQGSGKSNAMKLILLFVTALNRYAVVVDHSRHGEWAVFASQLARPQVVDAASGQWSMDPLKCLPSPMAETTLMSHYLPLFGFDSVSPEAERLAKILQPDYRRITGITSTRRLIEVLSNSGDAEARSLARNFEHWAALPYTRTFIDPPPGPRGGAELPPFDNFADLAEWMESGETPHCTVFRTHELPIYRGETPAAASDLNKWSAAVYGTIARMTAHRFSLIRGTCVFFGDEISFLKGNEDVVELLIRSPDRTGRKDRNFVVVASQHADDFDHNYAMIEKRAALRQPVVANAKAALTYMDMPELDRLVEMMTSQTSPPDPDNNNLPREGRQGEGWWNDGITTVRAQFLPILSTALARFADTTSSRMIRESDLDEQGRIRLDVGSTNGRSDRTQASVN